MLGEWLSEWVRDFSPRASSAMEGAKETKLAQGTLGDEDDTRTSNTCILQRKHTIPHSTMTNNRHNKIQCCNNTHQGVPHTGKRALTLHASVMASHVSCRGLMKLYIVQTSCCQFECSLQKILTVVKFCIKSCQTWNTEHVVLIRVGHCRSEAKTWNSSFGTGTA